MNASKAKYNEGLTQELTPEEKKEQLKNIIKKNMKDFQTAIKPDAFREPENVDEEKLQQLRETLMKMAFQNPEVLRINIDKELTNKINEMDAQELTQRILIAKNQNLKKMDNQIAKSVISATNSMVGRVLGIADELDNLTKDDILLADSTTQIISEYIFDIPPELRLASIYSLHVSKALGTKFSKMASEQDQNQEQKTE